MASGREQNARLVEDIPGLEMGMATRVRPSPMSDALMNNTTYRPNVLGKRRRMAEQDHAAANSTHATQGYVPSEKTGKWRKEGKPTKSQGSTPRGATTLASSSTESKDASEEAKETTKAMSQDDDVKRKCREGQHAKKKNYELRGGATAVEGSTKCKNATDKQTKKAETQDEDFIRNCKDEGERSKRKRSAPYRNLTAADGSTKSKNANEKETKNTHTQDKDLNWMSRQEGGSAKRKRYTLRGAAAAEGCTTRRRSVSDGEPEMKKTKSQNKDLSRKYREEGGFPKRKRHAIRDDSGAAGGAQGCTTSKSASDDKRETKKAKTQDKDLSRKRGEEGKRAENNRYALRSAGSCCAATDEGSTTRDNASVEQRETNDANARGEDLDGLALALAEQFEAIHLWRQCMFCGDRTAIVAFMPCGHITCCIVCEPPVCPECGREGILMGPKPPVQQ